MLCAVHMHFFHFYHCILPETLQPLSEKIHTFTIVSECFAFCLVFHFRMCLGAFFSRLLLFNQCVFCSCFRVIFFKCSNTVMILYIVKMRCFDLLFFSAQHRKKNRLNVDSNGETKTYEKKQRN